MSRIHHRSGVALLLSLLVLSGVLAAALTVSTLVVREYRTTSTVDRGVVTFYAAESGLEQGLYMARQERKTTAAEQEVTYANAITLPGSEAKWWRKADDTEEQLNFTLTQDVPVQIDLFNPDASLTQDLKSVTFRWNNDPATCPSAGPEWLEVLVSRSQRGSFSFDSYEENRQFISSTDGGSGITIPFDSAYFTYQLRLTARYANVCGLVVSVTASDDTPYALPTRLSITATAELADTRQAITITLPRQAPRQGVFDYAIFSQASICKDTEAGCP